LSNTVFARSARIRSCNRSKTHCQSSCKGLNRFLRFQKPSVVADRAQGRDAAWPPCSSSAPTRERAGKLKLPVCYCPPLPPFSRPHPAFSRSQARRVHCHRAAESSTACSSATTASHLNRLGRKHPLALFHQVLPLAKPTEQQVRLDKPLLATAMLGAPPTLRSTMAGAMLCFSMLFIGCFVLLGSCRNCRSCHFSCYRAGLTGTSHRTGCARHGHRRVELHICCTCLLVSRLESCPVRRSGRSSRAKDATG
jgi:hypothetical protein